MTCTMAAAGHQKKRFTNSSVPDQHRSKKKPKLHLSHSLVNFKSHIHLKWDNSSNKVIPMKEQIGISWSHLAPFVDSPRKRPSGLAHVTCVPREIFALENLSVVLSYGVWATFLTEADRKVLTQFLPTGTIAEEVMHLLLSGHNHHFGNPFLSWSSSLCHGDLHPDAVLDIEQRIRADKETYHADLHKYHSNMIQMLKKWKDKWLTCDNPENLFRYNPAKHRQGDLQSHRENIFSQIPKKEMPMKGVRNGDISKFMSYIKISRSQHDLVKRMKRSGDGVQAKHLTRVIGNIDNFHVKPYETLVEDEKKRLHNCWAILSCKDLPAAFVAREDRKLLIENLRKSLYLDLAQKNISVVDKAEQVTNIAEEVGRDGAFQNYGISDEQEELVEHSPQDVLQVGNDHNSVLEDEDVEDTSDADTSICSRDGPDMKMKDQFSLVAANGQTSSDERDQDLKNISCTNSGTDSGNSSDEHGEDLEDISYRNRISVSHSIPCVEDEGMKYTSCINTTWQDHNSPDMQAQEGISHEIAPSQSINSSNTLVHDLKNTSHASLPIRGHGSSDEQDDFKNISYPSSSTGRDMNNILSANNNPQMNHLTVDQKEAESISMRPSHSTLLFSEKGHVQGLELTAPAAKCEEDLLQLSNPVDAFYCPPGNSLHTQSGDLQHKHNYSGGQATMIDMGRDVRSQQQAQVAITAALPMGNSVSLLQQCTNQQNNQEVQSGVNGIGMVPSYSLGHENGIKQSIDLNPMTNNRLAQSAPVRDPLPGYMQLLDQRHNGLNLHQVQKNLYSGAGLCTQETFPMVERQGFGAHTPTDQSYNWFPNEDPSHDSWSAMESGGIEAQDLPSVSGADGSLFSVLSQYKQASSRVQLGALSSNQSLGTRNLVPPAQNVLHRAQNTAPPAPNIYGYTMNLPRDVSSHVASVDASVNNLQWANLAQQSHGVPDPSFGEFQGPWSR